MIRARHWWIPLVAVLLLLLVPACSENNLDESDADVVLEILGVQNPPVEGQVDVGTCSVSGNDCLTIDDCPEGEICDLPIVADECTVNDWTVQFANAPLNEAGMESPVNDIVISSVTLSYENLDGSMYAEDRVVPLSATILAGQQFSVTFAPLSFNDLATGGDNTTINVLMSFAAQTVSGHAVNVAGGTGAQLFIEDCLP